MTTASYWRPSGKNIDRYDAVSQETKKWGVQPDEGFLVELTEEEIFENIRQRNARDLQGLMTPEESKVVAEMREFDDSAGDDGEGGDGEGGDGASQSDQKPQTPLPDSQPENDADASSKSPGQDLSDPDAAEPHVDQPLQRAVDYLQSLKQRKRIAA